MPDCFVCGEEQIILTSFYPVSIMSSKGKLSLHSGALCDSCFKKAT